MGFPAARMTDMHVCPMCPVPPGLPIVMPCMPTVLIGYMPAARMTDLCVCIPPPPLGGDAIITGAFNVLIGGLPAARMTDLTAKGGTITTGFPTVLIGMNGVVPPPTPVSPGAALIARIANGESNIKIEGTDEYKQETLAALQVLASTPTGLALLQNLEASGKNITIKAPPPGKGNTENAANWNDGLYDRTNDKPGPGTDSTVNFDPNRTKLNSEDWMTRDPAVGLGHELIHSMHDANGTTDGRRSVNYTDADGNAQSAPGYELQTVGLGEYKDEPITENNIRKDIDELGLGRNDSEAQRPRY